MIGRGGTTRAAGAALSAMTLLLTACGVPTGDRPTVIAPTDVPYGLAAPSPTPSTTAPPTTSVTQPQVYLMRHDEVLVPRARDLTASIPMQRLTELLADLAGGPSSSERHEGLTTSISPGVTLTPTALENGVATIDIGGEGNAASRNESRRVVAQIVLTATSLPTVSGVLLTRAGRAIEAPLPSGALTSSPLTAADFESFLHPATPSPYPTTPSATPTQGRATIPAPTSRSS